MENASAIIKQIQQYTDEPPEAVICQLIDLWANYQSFVRSIVPESSAELPDRMEAIERKFNHVLLQTDQRCAETLQRVAEGEQKTGAALQRIKDQFDKLFGGLSDRVVAAEMQLIALAPASASITHTFESTPRQGENPFKKAIEGIAPTNHSPKPAKPKTKQIDLEALNLAQLRQLLKPNGLPQRIPDKTRYRNRAECLDVLGQLQDAGRLKQT